MCVKSRRSVGCARNDGKVKTENGVQDESDKGMMYCVLCHRVLHGGIFRALLSEKLCPLLKRHRGYGNRPECHSEE